jgi:multicomponent Na+:H+ antiporter subunit E
MAEQSNANEVLKSLPPQVQEATVICPLCGTAAPAIGFQARPGGEAQATLWRLVFVCPACGLRTAFDTAHLSLEHIHALQGSAWAAELAHYQQDINRSRLRIRRRATRRHFIGVFFICFITWIFLIGNLNPDEVLWGLVICLVISRFTYRFLLFDFWRWAYDPYRWGQFARLLLEFGRQLVVQNVTLALRVFRPNLPINPGIVAIPTKLRNDVQLTLLGSLMSLTPDTVTMDIDQERGIIYVHWIDVQTTDPQEARRLISASLEDKIIVWLG